ncbi:MAG: Gfo/Idh/MocA family oxidoreductase [Thermoleophilaceae bacterium]
MEAVVHREPAVPEDPLRAGLVGYGLAGSAFHAPLIEATPGLRLASVVTSRPERAERVREEHPHARVLPDVRELLADAGSHDLIVVASPNSTHVPFGLAALEAGLHVVVDKPLAGSVADARRLVSAAAEAPGLVCAVFHNRRWDGHVLTLRRLLREGALGELWRLESRLDRWRPRVQAGAWREDAVAGTAGGALFDLGPHLIDGALWLLGPAVRVYAEVDRRREGAAVDDDFFVAVTHSSGARSHLSAGLAAAQAGPRLRALGSQAAYVKWGIDPQEAALRGGERPDAPGFGREDPADWGTLGAGDAAAPVETEAGRYLSFYEEMEHAIRAGGPPPVPLDAGVATLEVIEAAFESARSGRTVALGG